MQTKHYVYILESQKDQSKYVGCSSDLSQRIKYHNNGFSQYTKSKIPWILKWYCVFFDREQAYQFEKYLKTSSGRSFIAKRIDGRVRRSVAGLVRRSAA